MGQEPYNECLLIGYVFLVCFDIPEKTLGNVGGGYGAYAFYRHNQPAVALNAVYVTLRSLERPVDNTDVLTYAIVPGTVAQVLKPLLTGSGYQHEQVHLPFGNGERQFLPAHKPGVQNDAFKQTLLLVQCLLFGRTEKQKGGDYRLAYAFLHFPTLHDNRFAGNEGLYTVFLQQLLYLEDFVIENLKSIPMQSWYVIIHEVDACPKGIPLIPAHANLFRIHCTACKVNSSVCLLIYEM